ncbi:MAG: nucleotidyltransferase [Bacteroidales bacterium]|jgi:NDP-sugar pyrophosphorylase family protein|nr:nucleotidyltransferase [Bacteroidales bacterium]
MTKSLLILAAGIGSRYGSLKQVDQLGPHGETIIDYSIYDAVHAGFEEVIFVIRKDIEAEFKEVIIDKYKNNVHVDYVLQEIDCLPAGFEPPSQRTKPWGTAHAVLMAKDKIKNFFAVVNGDDFYGRHSFTVLAQYLNALSVSDRHACSMVAYSLKNTLSDHGTVSRGVCTLDASNNLIGIEEHTKIEKVGNTIISHQQDGTTIELSPDTPVSMNFWGFHPSIFGAIEQMFIDFLRENIHNNTSEFYISSVVDALIKSGIIQIKVLPTDASWYGITYREDRPKIVEKFKEMQTLNIYPKINEK